MADLSGNRDVATNYRWTRLSECAYQARLPFCDVNVGAVVGATAVLIIDCGTTLIEARRVADDLLMLADRPVRHVVLTHAHFDHVLGSSAFASATVYAAPQAAALLATGRAELRADAVHHGADPELVDAALAALRPVDRTITNLDLDLGGLTVHVAHPGSGHTDHDLVVLVPAVGPSDRPVVFCGDLVEESGDPAIGADAELPAWPGTLDRVLEVGGPDAIYVPGHGVPVGSDFVHRQRDWLAGRREPDSRCGDGSG
ncbi:MBL fold metallo-hydrolase [Mycobacterium sp. M1]|uniref:MBL fold metallo-hydrolase n=1 Tax=Mycolicibacter acidiphilus TaxID=2835306 RepID=A0ABS5RKF1_9MYCO|nr:MBL fold metallo-hydrolase [Mycolicibacter acidiphilus]MBS9534766.1 MBL fold metallo-hydrolase [Mycolicibacter acidiphilus]